MHFERSWSKGFALDPYVVRTALTPATKLIVISNAHNPSGAMASRDALEQIGVMAEAIGARVLVDEVYAEAQYDEAPLPRPAATLGEVFVSTSSLTKAYGLAGLALRMDPRVAVGVGARPRDSRRDRRQRPVRRRAPVADGVRAHRSPEIARAADPCRESVASCARWPQSHPRLEWLEPAAGTTAFPRVTDVDDTSDLVERLIRDHDTIVVPGHFFQAPQHIRIAFGGRSEMIREAMTRLDRALRE